MQDSVRDRNEPACSLEVDKLLSSTYSSAQTYATKASARDRNGWLARNFGEHSKEFKDIFSGWRRWLMG